MKASAPRRRRNADLREAIALDKAAQIMAAAEARDDLPVEAIATYHARNGRVTRVFARYADGWRFTLVLYSDGSYRVSRALSVKVTVRP